MNTKDLDMHICKAYVLSQFSGMGIIGPFGLYKEYSDNPVRPSFNDNRKKHDGTYDTVMRSMQ